MPMSRGTFRNHTRERVDAIMAGWRAGHTYGQMGKRFNLEKNVVAGIVHRNKQPGELSARTGPGGRTPRRTRHVPVAVALPAPKRLRGVGSGQMPTGRTVVHTAKMAVPGGRFRGCQFIAGQKGVDFKLYADAPRCPAEPQPGSSYCPEHHERCHAKQQSQEAA